MTIEQQKTLALVRARLRNKTKTPTEPAFEKEARELQSVTTPELIAGSAPARFALGAASPILGAAQLGAQVLGDKTGTETLAQLEKMKQAGMKAYGQEGMDIVGLGGTLLSPPFLMAGKAIAPAEKTLGKIGQGVAIGGVAGATTPVINEEDYWSSKGGQALLGMTVGGVIPGTIQAAKATGRGIKNLADMFTEKGAGRILSRYQGRIVGEENIPQVSQALKTAPEIIPGGKPTAAQALAETPAGSPLMAHQRITAQTPGGISAQFGERKVAQESAIKAAEQARSEVTTPMREGALDAANQVGGVRASLITNKIDEIAVKPGLRASEVVQKSLSEIKDKVSKAVETGGKIDARDLYTIRKEIGNTVDKFAKETANWDKRLTAGLQRQIQQVMDDAIEGSGGRGWKEYLNEYSRRSQMIDAYKERILKAARPAQRTELGGGVNIAEESRLRAPQLLSRPMMMTNFILRKLGQGVEEKIDPEAARRYLNPEVLATELQKVPAKWRPQIVQDLINRGRIPALGTISSAAVEE